MGHVLYVQILLRNKLHDSSKKGVGSDVACRNQTGVFSRRGPTMISRYLKMKIREEKKKQKHAAIIGPVFTSRLFVHVCKH